MNSIEDIKVQRVRGTNDSFKTVETVQETGDRRKYVHKRDIRYRGLIEFRGRQHEEESIFAISFHSYQACRLPELGTYSRVLLILSIVLCTLVNFVPLVYDHSDAVNNTTVEQIPEPFSRWPNRHQDVNQIQQFFQILSDLSRRNTFDQTQHGPSVVLLNVTSPSLHDGLSNGHDTGNRLYARNDSSNIGLDDTENVQSSRRANTYADVNAQERNLHTYMNYLPIGTDRNYSMTYCKLLYTEDNNQKVDEPMTNKNEETNTKNIDKADFMTQTNEAVNNERTNVENVSIQTHSFVDFRYIRARDDPDGQSRNDSNTDVKIVSCTVNQSDSDNTTHVKEVNTTFSDCRQSYTEDWIDSLDVLIGSYRNGSHNDIGNLSLESSSSVPEICNADQYSSGDEDDNDETEATHPYAIADLSFDSDDMFGD